MGFFLTLLYIALALLSPEDLLPSLAPYRLQLVVAIAAMLFSVPGLLDRRFSRIPQVYLLAGLLVTVAGSAMVSSMWIMAGGLAFLKFLPAAMVFYLVVLNCQSLKRLRIVASVVTGIAILYIVQGSRAYLTGDTSSPLLQVIPVSDGTVTFRMQGLGFLHDANELAQLLVMLIPFLWTRWRQNQHLQNVFFVIAPTALFVWGIYLTHSRGAMVALVLILILSLRRRVGLVPTMAAAAVAASLLLALNFSGGREVSVHAGSDRFTLWGDGLEMFKQHPLLGVGFGNFGSQDFGHTAHNSFVVCLAELGIIGYSLWMGLIAFSLSGLNSLIVSVRDEELDPAALEDGTASDEEKTEFNRWATALQISLGGFLAAAFFLSRAYVFYLYLILGMAVALLALSSGEEEPIGRKPLRQLIGLTAKFSFAAIVLVYIALRARSLFGAGS